MEHLGCRFWFLCHVVLARNAGARAKDYANISVRSSSMMEKDIEPRKDN